MVRPNPRNEMRHRADVEARAFDAALDLVAAPRRPRFAPAPRPASMRLPDRQKARACRRRPRAIASRIASTSAGPDPAHDRDVAIGDPGRAAAASISALAGWPVIFAVGAVVDDHRHALARASPATSPGAIWPSTMVLSSSWRGIALPPSPAAQRGEQRLAIAVAAWLSPIPSTSRQRGQRRGPRRGHLAQRRIVEHDVGRNALLLGQRRGAPRAAPRTTDREAGRRGPRRALARAPGRDRDHQRLLALQDRPWRRARSYSPP